MSSTMMWRRFARFLGEWAQMRRFNALAPVARSIVFYAEDAGTGVHFEPIIRELTGPMRRTICYLTSSAHDPVLAGDQENVHPFCIGTGAVRTAVFMGLRAGVLVMTMPDLETFHIKRSRLHPVHYVYLFHSMVSTHMIYRKGAFDHFDTVLCVGPHQVEEIRRTEAIYGLKPKNLIEHGYGRLDAILRDKAAGGGPAPGGNGRMRRVVVAPSWGPDGLLETQGIHLTELLLNAGYHVTVRPHPMTRRKYPQVLCDLENRFRGRSDFLLEEDLASAESLKRSDVMISDWSGAALEYAFGFERPVLFVDVARKVNNPDYGDISCEPLEVGIRSQIGVVVSPAELGEVPAAIDRLCADPEGFKSRIARTRSRTVYNAGSSGPVGARCIADIADAVMKRENAG